MKEVKYKGRRRSHYHGGAWVWVFECLERNNHSSFDWLELWAPIKRDSVMQYTGLKDIEGTRIHEGDLVRIVNNEGVPEGLLGWVDVGSVRCMALEEGSYCATNGFSRIWGLEGHNLIVIGNIYDNPELLEVENEQSKTLPVLRLRGETLMNYEQEIKKLEAQIEELKQKIEAEKEAPPVWEPGKWEEYYVTSHHGVSEYHWCDHSDDRNFLEVGNLFKTKQEVEVRNRALKLIETIRRERFKAQGSWWPNERETMFSICWDRLKNDLGVITTSWLLPSSVFGLWQDLGVMRGVIKKHESELKWYFIEYLPSIN